MQPEKTVQRPPRKQHWQKTQYANSIRLESSGTYYPRVRIAGKAIRKSSETQVLSVALLRLNDFAKEERGSLAKKTELYNYESLIQDYVRDLDIDYSLKNNPP
jgi:hypothetical protein